MTFSKEEFFEAVENNDVLKIAFFSHLGAKINFRDSQGRTAIHIAVEHGYVDLVEVLMGMGGDPYKFNFTGEHALTIPFSMSPESCMQVMGGLLELGLDPDIENGKGLTPLQKAIMGRYLDVIPLLLKHNASILKKTRVYSPLTMLTSPDYDFPGREDIFATVFKYLNLDAQDPDGRTVLHQIITETPQKDLVFKILKRGANPNVQDNEGNTPLHLSALEFDTRQLLPLLLGHGANPYIRNDQGSNCFTILKSKGEHGLLSLLKEYAAKHKLRDKFGVST